MAMVAPNDVSLDQVKCPVIKAWLNLPFLCSRAADGRLAHVLKDTIDRQTVADNAEMLEPLIAEFGILVKIFFSIQNYPYPCQPRINKYVQRLIWRFPLLKIGMPPLGRVY